MLSMVLISNKETSCIANLHIFLIQGLGQVAFAFAFFCPFAFFLVGVFRCAAFLPRARTHSHTGAQVYKCTLYTLEKGIGERPDGHCLVTVKVAVP